MQGVLYTFYELIHFRFKKLNIEYDREVFTLSDGGELAIEWYNGLP